MAMFLSVISRRLIPLSSGALVLSSNRPLREPFVSIGNLRCFSSASHDLHYFAFPKEQEGNNYGVNWSLVEDGVVSNGIAFRNAKHSQLSKSMKLISRPKWDGKYLIEEAGDNLDHSVFNNYLLEAQHNLSLGKDLFVEDGFVGAHRDARTGVRLITTNPHSASLLRSVLVPTPYFDVDPRARFDGWNLDGRWNEHNYEWKGNHYMKVAHDPLSGQRPIVVYDGLSGDKVALQFIQSGERIVGANIVVGTDAPKRSIVDTIGYASAVLNNNKNRPFLFLPCTTIFHKDKTAYLVNGDETILSHLLKSGYVYSPYYSGIGANGVTSIWSGAVREVADEMVVSRIDPDNLIPPIATILVLGNSNPTSEDLLKALDVSVDGTSATQRLQSFVNSCNVKGVSSIEEIRLYLSN